MPRSTKATSMLIGVAFLCFVVAGGGIYFTLKNAGGGGTVPQPSTTEATPLTTPTPAPTPPTTPTPGTAANGVESYTVRGRIVALPGKSGKQPLDIHHEEIPTFLGKSGKVVGMKEMIMPFADLAAGVKLDGLAAGDPVEFVFEVRWNAAPRTLVTRITKLPAETKLNLSAVLEEGK